MLFLAAATDDEFTLLISLMYFLLLTMVNVGETPRPKFSSRLTLSKPSIERSSNGTIPAWIFFFFFFN